MIDQSVVKLSVLRNIGRIGCLSAVEEALTPNFYVEMVQLICKAALDPAEWAGVMSRISAEFGGMRSHLVSYDLLSAGAAPNYFAGFDEQFVQPYFDHFQYSNPWSAKWAESKIGLFAATWEMVSREDLEATEFFHDWVKPQENAQAGGGVVLVREPSRAFMLGGNLPLAEMERSQDRYAAALNLLAPILRHAIEVNRMLSAHRVDALALRAGVEPDAAALVMLGADGIILNCNPMAERLLAQGDVLAVGMRGRVLFRRASLQERLTANLVPCRFGKPALADHFTAAQTDSGFDCRLVPIAPDQSPILSSGLLRRERVAALLILVAGRSDTSQQAALIRTFGLSGAEAEVAMLLHHGLVPAEIAARRGVSLNTVRNQIKSALSKSDSRRQADLTRLIEGLRVGVVK